MIIQLTDGHTARWNGGHYINFFDENGVEFDCMSFGWEKNKISQVEALEAYLRCQDIVMGDYDE
jgi:hypothetical protein